MITRTGETCIPVVLAIDAGGSFFKSALIDERGTIFVGSQMEAPVNSAGDSESILGRYRYIIKASLGVARSNGLSIKGLGVATPGPFDYVRGTSLMEHKFDAIRDLPLRECFRGASLLSDDTPIVFLQDVHAFLLGEHWNGAVAGLSNIAAITLGTGLGLGLMQGGKILDNGSGGPREVLFKHPFAGGILEDRISRRGIIAAFREQSRLGMMDLDVLGIADQARRPEGNIARDVFSETGRILGDAISGLLAKYEISDVVFGGQISKAFGLLGPAIEQSLSGSDHQVRIVMGRNIESSSLLGVARTLWDDEMDGI